MNKRNINKFYEEHDVQNCCQINEDEYAFYIRENDKEDILIFYDIQADKNIEKLIVGKGENDNGMKLVNKNNLIISGDDSLILIDIKNRKIVNELKFDNYFDFDNICCLNEKTFLYYEYIGLLFFQSIHLSIHRTYESY